MEKHTSYYFSYTANSTTNKKLEASMYRKMGLQPRCMQALQRSYQSKVVQNTHRFIATAYKKNGSSYNKNKQNNTLKKQPKSCRGGAMHEPQKKSKNKPKKLIFKIRKTFLIYMLTKKHYNTLPNFKKIRSVFLSTP
jgi:isocitrate/isopropylmalate dehydrogenase